MPARERGGSGAGFRAQILAHLRNQARATHVATQRLQQRVAFERFLARLGPSGEWVLNGGFALELRYGWGSRPTRDIDLRVGTGLAASLVQLRTAVAESAGADHFSFELAGVPALITVGASLQRELRDAHLSRVSVGMQVMEEGQEEIEHGDHGGEVGLNIGGQAMPQPFEVADNRGLRQVREHGAGAEGSVSPMNSVVPAA